MSLKNVFITNLSCLLESTNTKKIELAKFLGVTPQSITGITQGVSWPTVENLAAMADYFNVTIDFLVGRSILYKEPEGVLDYCFKDESGLLIGKFKYIFGTEKANTKLSGARKFIYLEEIEGTLIKKILASKSQMEFLSLVYLLNSKLQLNYDAFENNGIDILIKLDGNYKELHIEPGPYSARVSDPSYEEKFLNDWLSLSIKNKKKLLNAY